MQTAAVIVAAGQSSRMGAFKPLLPLADTTMIGHAIETLKAFGVSPIVVVTGREAAALAQYLYPYQVECVHNPDYAATDMFCSACIGFEALRSRADRVFFLPVDSPLFSADCLAALCAEMDRSGCGVARPCYEGRCGHPILIDAKLLPSLTSFHGDGGLRRAIESTGCLQQRVEVSEPGLLLDADTPDDYARIQQMLCK